MSPCTVQFLSGNEAIALAARAAGVTLGTGYPGTPSTEILEQFSAHGGRAQWCPNEKVALEVGMGVAYARGRALITMKHVGVNVAADPLFTLAYTGVEGSLVLVSADDPGMASSQNEQDNRRIALAAGVPMLEPADAQEAYDYTLRAFEISQRWSIPVMLRMTTRVCHSKSPVRPTGTLAPPPPAAFTRDISGRVMIPAHARPAHHRLRVKLAEIAGWIEAAPLAQAAAAAIPDALAAMKQIFPGRPDLGIITSGVASLHAREAAPEASLLKLGLTNPLPFETIRRFATGVARCIVIEEGDPYLVEQLRTAGIPVEGKPDMFRFGELNVSRVRHILAGDTTPETGPSPGKPPQLCPGCPHRSVFEVLRELDCIVAGDIGCYTLAALPPFEAMDTQSCMGASIGVGLGLRHTLPPEQARRVVSIIGDSTFVHSGLTGLVEMVYNPPATGHVLLILDNGTTAMTGLQEHPGTGRTLDHHATARLSFEAVARAVGVPQVHVVDPDKHRDRLRTLLRELLDSQQSAVIICRRPCVLAASRIRQYEAANHARNTSHADPSRQNDRPLTTDN